MFSEVNSASPQEIWKQSILYFMKNLVVDREMSFYSTTSACMFPCFQITLLSSRILVRQAGTMYGLPFVRSGLSNSHVAYVEIVQDLYLNVVPTRRSNRHRSVILN